MGSVVVLRYANNQRVTDISSLSILAGIAWGSCFLPVVPLDFSRDAMESARGFGSYYVNASRQQIYEQYCRLDEQFRLEIELYEFGITKDVCGFSFGIDTGGVLGELGDVITSRPIRRGLVWLQRSITGPLSNFIRNQITNLAEDAIDSSVGSIGNFFNLSSGTSGGFLNMYDGGALHGANGHSTLNLEVSSIRRMNCAIIQLKGGFAVEAGINLLLIGSFPSLSTFNIRRRRDDSVFEVASDLMAYLNRVFSELYCYTVVGDAGVGIIPPGVDINIIAS